MKNRKKNYKTKQKSHTPFHPKKVNKIRNFIDFSDPWAGCSLNVDGVLRAVDGRRGEGMLGG